MRRRRHRKRSAHPRDQPKRWQLKNRLMKTAAREITRLERLGSRDPVKMANVQAYLDKRGIKMGIEGLSKQTLAIVQKLHQERMGIEKTFAISPKEEAAFLKQAKYFVEAMRDARRLGIAG